MKLEARNTIGGYRIELCSENEKELVILKEIENIYSKRNIEIIKDIKKSLDKISGNKGDGK